jgi:hypothetical protein
MLSRLRPLIYTDIDPDVLDHDDDLDAELYTYEEREVYRGRYDPRYTSLDLDVHWLYDENGKRVGLAEYDSNDFSKNSVLWYRDNTWSTLLQENWKSKEKTLWSMMSNEAYQDCLEDDFETVIERTKDGPYCLVFPGDVLKAKKTDLPVLFLDDSFVLYDFPVNSRVWDLLWITPPPQSGLQSDASAEVQAEQAHPPPDQEPQTEHLSEEQETVQEQGQ